jgi:hypothetical protein
MEAFANTLLFFAVLYGVYALGAFAVPRAEVSTLLARFPKAWFLAPFRLLLWALLLPMVSTFEALVLAFLAFSLSGLLLVLQ